MESIGKYLLSIIITAAICGILNTLISDKTASYGIIRMISGIIMAVVVVAPLIDVKLSAFDDYIDTINIEANDAAQTGVTAVENEATSIIKKQLEAYILDKAESLNLSVCVDLIMTETFPPSPYSVQITGSVSPYNKKVLSNFISTELSVPEERQIWK